ncbi:MAG: hypothetical protein PHQ43_00165 [Dehalococcoidales bacterium]|nr:hypothetical protein [Dehalococcoidales bacterium]
MSVGTNTYGSVTGVERLIGDIVASRTFGASTVPTTTQVEAELDNVAAEINSELEMAGYTVPVNSTSYPTAHAYLAASNNYGAAARLLGTIPALSYNPEGDTDNSRQQMYENLLKRCLKNIKEGKLNAAHTQSVWGILKSGSEHDADGNDKVPLFTRDRDSYPGTRDYTE